MKKFIAIVCILAMCLGVMAGCMEKVDNSVDTSAPVGTVVDVSFTNMVEDGWVSID